MKYLALFIMFYTILSKMPDYYILQLTWPGSFCANELNQCKREYFGSGYQQGTWTVHGLWPQELASGKGKPIINCNKFETHRKEDLTGSQMAQLNKAMIGLSVPTQEFRSHEWSVHGTCWSREHSIIQRQAGKPYPNIQSDYFENIYRLWSQLQIHDALYKAGIRPDDNNQITVKSVLEAIEGILHINVKLVCYHQKQYQYLLAVNICIDNQKNIGAECEYDLNNECEYYQKIIYPTLKI